MRKEVRAVSDKNICTRYFRFLYAPCDAILCWQGFETRVSDIVKRQSACLKCYWMFFVKFNSKVEISLRKMTKEETIDHDEGIRRNDNSTCLLCTKHLNLFSEFFSTLRFLEWLRCRGWRTRWKTLCTGSTCLRKDWKRNCSRWKIANVWRRSWRMLRRYLKETRKSCRAWESKIQSRSW